MGTDSRKMAVSRLVQPILSASINEPSYGVPQPSRWHLHEVVLPVLVSVLVARSRHVLLAEEIIVRMILLVLQLLSLLLDPGLFLLLEWELVSTDSR